MKIKVEQYGTKIGVDNNLTECLLQKKMAILMTVKNDDDTLKTEFVIGRQTAENLIESLIKLLSDEETAKLGVTYFETVP